MRTRAWIGVGAAAGATAVAAVASTAFQRYRRELKDKTDALEARHQFVETSHGAVEYTREGSGPAALVIHGAGGGFDQGLYLGRDMLSLDFDIIAPSRFGYLGTPVPEDASIPAQADAHAALLDKLGIDEAIVMGVSAGAPSAIELAVRHPSRVRALILVVPRAYDPQNQVGVEDTGLNKAAIRMFEKSADFTYWLSSQIARKPLVRFFGVEPKLEGKAAPEQRERITAIIKDMLPLSQRVHGIEIDNASGVPEPDLAKVTAPTLIISAEDDLYHTLPGARYAAEHIPGAQLKVFQTGGHLLLSHEADTRLVIANFLRDRLGLEATSASLAQGMREELISVFD
jgi:2-hydroxy-6-oxonona-2,4-dienedioate hydrolase